jgi:hypothetical protein
MKRRLFNLAAAVSLVLCAATVGLWVRSHPARRLPKGDVVRYEGHGHSIMAGSANGRIRAGVLFLVFHKV